MRNKSAGFKPAGFVLFVLLFSLSVVCPPAQASPATGKAAKEAPPFKTDEGYLLNIKNADMAVMLELYSRLTGKAILPSSQVSGKVNIINQERVSKEEAIAIIESVLELNGFSTVIGDKVIKVVPKRNAVKRNIYLGTADEGIKPADRVETHLVGLKNIKAENAKSIITPLLSDVGNITVDKESNVLVLTEVASNSARLVRILRKLDIAPVRRKPVLKSYPVHYADARDVIKKLDAYYKKRPRDDNEPAPTFMADKRLNSVLATALPSIHKEIPSLLGIFDRPTPGRSAENLVIHLEYAKAANVAKILTKLLSGSPAKGGGSGTGQASRSNEKEIAVVADEPTNTLIISANRRRFPEIRDIVRTLDVRSKQVLVKALIMEVTLRHGNRLGISWQYDNDESYVRSEMGSPLTTGTPFSSAQTALQGLKYAWMDPGRLHTFLEAVITGSRVNILSSPHILTVDNKPAEIIVGQEVPYTKDSRVSDQQAVIKTNEYRKVGVKLKVTPRITEGSDVLMEIQEEISGLSGVDPDLDAPIFFTREAKATVICRSGNTVVIGGLIRNETNETRRKVPILGDLPLIKNAFRFKEKSSEKTELIAFITPVVISDDRSSDAVTNTMMDDFTGHIKERDFQKEIDELFDRVTRDSVPDEVKILPRPADGQAGGTDAFAPARGDDQAVSGSGTVVRLLDPPEEPDLDGSAGETARRVPGSRSSGSVDRGRSRDLSSRARAIFDEFRKGSER